MTLLEIAPLGCYLSAESGPSSKDRLQLRRRWNLPVQEAVKPGDARVETIPTFAHEEHRSTAGATEDGTADEHLRADCAGLAITSPACCTLKPCEQIEENQHAAEGASMAWNCCIQKRSAPRSCFSSAMRSPYRRVGCSRADFFECVVAVDDEAAKCINRAR